MSQDRMLPANDTITYLMIDIARILRTQIQQALARLGVYLTEAETRALVTIMEFPGCNQKSIAEKMEIEPMTLLGLLVQLERQGLITRERQPHDRRSKVLYPTPEAAPALAARMAVGRAVRVHIAKQMGAEAAEDLRLGLMELYRAVRVPMESLTLQTPPLTPAESSAVARKRRARRSTSSGDM